MSASAVELLDVSGKRSTRNNINGESCWHIQYDAQSFQIWGKAGGSTWEVSFSDWSAEVNEQAICRILFAMSVCADIDVIRESLEDFRVVSTRSV